MSNLSFKDDVKRFHYYNELFILYKNLLTEKQRAIAEKFICYDLSETEIADELEISRNAIYDALDKALAKLDYYEKQLGLYKKYKKLDRCLHLYEFPQDEVDKILEILYYGI